MKKTKIYASLTPAVPYIKETKKLDRIWTANKIRGNILRTYKSSTKWCVLNTLNTWISDAIVVVCTLSKVSGTIAMTLNAMTIMTYADNAI